MNAKRNDERDTEARRGFLKCTALLGGGMALGNSVPFLGAQADAGAATPGVITPALARPENHILTVCLQCNTGCGLRVKIDRGTVAKLEGSPYSPWTMVPSIDYATSLPDAARLEGSLCPKGQAGLQTLYDPYRIVKVLKRAGRRGENEWTSIPFAQAIQEIVEGGKLFRSVPGEEHREVEGLRSLWALRDPKLGAEMSAAIDVIRAKKAPAEKQAAVAEFKRKFAANLDVLIDPDHPDFGPRNNQVSFVWGRLKAGRSEFIKRFISESFGSTNAHGHTTVCQGSLYFTGKAMSDQFENGKLAGGQKFYWQADTSNVDFLLAIGSAYIEGGYGPTHHAKKMMKRLVEGKLRLAVVDPRLSKIASKAWRWVPAKPGSEAALALGMIRWILDEKRHDKKFLSSANRAGAALNGEASWTNATWLVKNDGAFLRGSDLGFAKQMRTAADGKEWAFDPYVVSWQGGFVPFDPNDEQSPVIGDPLVTTTLGGFEVRSALQVIHDEARSHSIEEWAAICGIDAKVLVELAREFTSHGKRAVADPHRGVAQHTNGFYGVLAVYCLNALVGNWDWKGGLIKATTYNILGEKEGQPFPIAKMHPAKLKPFGLSIIRHEAKYEDSTLFAGYPAKRNWYPFSSDVYQEILPSMADRYPYATKAVFLYMAAPTYSLPGGHTNIEVLVDPEKIPLVISSDVTIGETSMYADYIFPDLSYLERWEFHGSHPSIPQKVQTVRNPAAAPVPEAVGVFGESIPISLEAMILGIAEKLGLPGFGPVGLGAGMPLNRPEDFYLKLVANTAAGDKPGDAVAEADEEELRIFLAARSHLPRTVFDPDRWRASAGEANWRRVVYLLNRGGRFQAYDKAYDGEKFANKYGKQINLYLERYALSVSPMTGKKLAGRPVYQPVMDVLGREIKDEDEGFDLHLITNRVITQTKSRTVVDHWLTQIQPSNEILINPVDAKRLRLGDGDRVKVVSRTNPEGVWDLKNGVKKPMVGAVQVIEGIRPGVVTFSLGKGHWASGASDLRIDGQLIKADARRGTGVHANAAMRLDDYLKNTCLLDPVGGSVSFYDTKVRLLKV